jgi:hypothetical protein
MMYEIDVGGSIVGRSFGASDATYAIPEVVYRNAIICESVGIEIVETIPGIL